MSAAAWGLTASIFISSLMVFIDFFDRSIAKPIKIYKKHAKTRSLLTDKTNTFESARLQHWFLKWQGPRRTAERLSSPTYFFTMTELHHIHPAPHTHGAPIHSPPHPDHPHTIPTHPQQQETTKNIEKQRKNNKEL